MAIYVAKHLLGGLGYNIFNPALIGRAFLLATFPVAMTSAWLPPLRDASIFAYMGSGVDAVSTATPLYVLKNYGMAALMEKFGSDCPAPGHQSAALPQSGSSNTDKRYKPLQLMNRPLPCNRNYTKKSRTAVMRLSLVDIRFLNGTHMRPVSKYVEISPIFFK